MNPQPNPWARPQTLVEVASDAASMADFHCHVRDFLHEFKFDPRRDRVADEPPSLRDRFAGGEVADAYLAAVAVEMSLDLGCARPAWTRAAWRALDRPWFAAKTEGLRLVLLHESPAGFRERNLFVSENALSVA